ncbi:UNVERIFIED_CONTAM: hypothetical protein GTU68_052913 [Idotea baltica]|nr:hypothetical protein [Idotea baltica]
MIVVAIIGVLSAIAIPAYKDYVSKSEAASGLATIKALQTPAELFFQEKGTGTAPALDELGTTTGANALGLITATTSTIVFTFGTESALSGKALTLTRDSVTGWTCEAAAGIPSQDGCQAP